MSNISIKQISINDESGISEYKVTSKTGCCFKDLMPKNVKQLIIDYVSLEDGNKGRVIYSSYKKEIQALKEQLKREQDCVDKLAKVSSVYMLGRLVVEKELDWDQFESFQSAVLETNQFIKARETQEARSE